MQCRVFYFLHCFFVFFYKNDFSNQLHLNRTCCLVGDTLASHLMHDLVFSSSLAANVSSVNCELHDVTF